MDNNGKHLILDTNPQTKNLNLDRLSSIRETYKKTKKKEVGNCYPAATERK